MTKDSDFALLSPVNERSGHWFMVRLGGPSRLIDHAHVERFRSPIVANSRI